MFGNFHYGGIDRVLWKLRCEGSTTEGWSARPKAATAWVRSSHGPCPSLLMGRIPDEKVLLRAEDV